MVGPFLQCAEGHFLVTSEDDAGGAEPGLRGVALRNGGVPACGQVAQVFLDLHLGVWAYFKGVSRDVDGV